MGEDQDQYARAGVKNALMKGTWIVLCNCHLGLKYMNELSDFLNNNEDIDNAPKDFRIWITTEQQNKFPLALLQNSIKVTNEPPRGIKASLHKIFTTKISQDDLEKIEHPNWKILIFYMAFLHSIVIERIKFGALGWCIPY